MTAFVWDESLDVSVAEMNEQHRVLIGLMNILYSKNEQGADKSALLDSVEDLLRYVVQHFSEEEAYMAQIAFPNLEAHKTLHGRLLEDLHRFADAFKNSEEHKLSKEFALFLNLWLATHIRGIDTKYGRYAQTLKA